jgi:16S rRNA processing protein RimM
MTQPRHRFSRYPDNRAGSGGRQPEPSEPEFLIVGRIVRPHGIRGELAMKLITDYPDRLLDIKTLYLGPQHQPYQIKRIRRHSEGVLIQFAGISDRNQAEHFREMLAYIHIDDAVPLEEGEYYLYQLEGISIVTDTGKALGHLTGLIETGANDVYIVTTPEGGEILLPAIPEVIKEVNISERVMIVHLLEGLI